MEVAKLENRISQLQLSIQIDDNAKRYLVNESAGPSTGARGLRRVLEDKLQDKIADLIIDGNLTRGGVVNVSLPEDGNLIVNVTATNEVQ